MKLDECTIRIEKETQAHYERLSRIVSNDELKRLFSLIASAKAEYITKLTTLQESRAGAAASDTLSMLPDGICHYRPRIDPWRLAESLKDDADAYRHLELEERGMIEFFDRLEDQTDDETLKQLCRAQAANEREHLEMLERIYFFVEEPRTYLAWAEFSNLKSL